MELILRFLIKISSLNRPIALVTLKILKLLNKNRGYFKIGNNIMFLDFLDPIDRKIIINKKYEENEISTLRRLTKDFSANYFFDIGANNGYYSLKFAEFYDSIKVIAFEPNMKLILNLKKQ